MVVVGLVVLILGLWGYSSFFERDVLLSPSCGDEVCAVGEVCPEDCLSTVCLDKEKKDIIDTIWENRKPFLLQEIQVRSQTVPTALYDIQWFTKDVLEAASYCKDYEYLDELAGLYLYAYDTLQEQDTYIYRNLVGGDGRKTLRSLTPSAKMWVDSEGDEVILESSQFLYTVAKLINAIAGIDSSERTGTMNDLITRFVPVIMTDHYERWVFGEPGVFQVTG